MEECEVCGCAVLNQEKHTAFHAPAPEPEAQPLPEAPSPQAVLARSVKDSLGTPRVTPKDQRGVR